MLGSIVDVGGVKDIFLGDGALQAIQEAEFGNHDLGSAHTLKNFETAFTIPAMMDHNSYEQWLAEGVKDANL